MNHNATEREEGNFGPVLAWCARTDHAAQVFEHIPPLDKKGRHHAYLFVGCPLSRNLNM
jgi:hypothetical protein